MHNASQEDIFTYCAEDIVKQVTLGYNGTIMCYGQTGAGKTFTMNGSTPNYKYRGLIPRCITQVFTEIGHLYDQEISVSVSYLEIYNEQIFDLLSDEARDPKGGSGISIQDDAKGEVHVKGLQMSPVANEEQALNFLFEGETKKTIAATNFNQQSSRAHSVYTIYLQSKARTQ
jgi:kinesin family protein 6/9